jgi:hypothetical protein
MSCGHCSRRIEPFTDLSLDFPERYHAVDGNDKSPCIEAIHVNGEVTEMVRASFEGKPHAVQVSSQQTFKNRCPVA